ncbi:MAG: hypothetical protein CMJ51_04675 [Planctomycetaceae bacterium]|nr:hypothetical protein [Planctomycetaceae bacterium]
MSAPDIESSFDPPLDPAFRSGRRQAISLLGLSCVGIGSVVSGCRGPEDPGEAPPVVTTGGRTGPTEDDARGDRGRPRPPSTEPLMRVRVGRVDADEVELGAASRLFWLTAPGTGYAGMHGGPIRLKRTSTGWTIRSTSRGRTVSRRIPEASAITIVASDQDENGPAFKEQSLRGTVHVVALQRESGRSLDVVCHIPMESYLPGVLAGELFESWRPATHESLAIAARSFAVCERHHWLSRRHYDVVAGERSQAWQGGSAPRRAREAVQKTAGRVLLYRDRVVPAYYSAACGGRPAAALDAISPNPVNGIPPLAIPARDRRGLCSCRSFGPHGAWRTSFNATETLAAIRRRAIGAGGAGFERASWPLRFRVVEAHASGRPRRYRIESPASKEVGEMTAVELQRLLNGIKKGRRVRSADFEVMVRPDGIQIDGSGFGHGVGLCQYGSEFMARSGASSEAILRRYYPGSELRRAW